MPRPIAQEQEHCPGDGNDAGKQPRQDGEVVLGRERAWRRVGGEG
jgi:hypothetical protein